MSYEQEPVHQLQPSNLDGSSTSSQFNKEDPERPSASKQDESDGSNGLPYDDLADLAKEDEKESHTYTLLGDDTPIPPAPGDQSKYMVTSFLTNDPEDPQNWPGKIKFNLLALASLTAMAAAGGSAIISGGVAEIKKEFHVGTVVSALTISLYVAGFAVGPVIWGPLSEILGRRNPLLIGVFGMTLFAFAAATAKDYQTLCLSRFFMGTFGAATLTVTPPILADIFDGAHRGMAMAAVTLMICAGPMLSPVVGGYIGASYLGWRWTQYIAGIFSALVMILITLFLKETYPAKLLSFRAAIIREETGNWAVSAPLDNMELDAHDIVQRTVFKPMYMLAVEPILLLVSLYHGLVYGILYLCLEAVPIIFAEKYRWKGGNVYLPYLGMLVGSILVCVSNVFFFEPDYLKKLKASGKPVLPEQRLIMMIVAGILFPMGIFLMCWSGNYKTHWIVPVIGLALLGYGLMGIFMSAFNYIIDSYLMLAASAIAANTFLRSGFGAAFPLFATAMFHNLGIEWAGTLLGCLACLIVPVPFLFFIYGAKIRTKSKFAVNTDELGRDITRTSTTSRQASRVVSRPKSFLAV